MDNNTWTTELWLFAGYYHARDRKLYEKFYKCSAAVGNHVEYDSNQPTYLPKHRTLAKVIGGLYTVDTCGVQAKVSTFRFVRKTELPELSNWKIISDSETLSANTQRVERQLAKSLIEVEHALQPLLKHYAHASAAKRIAIEVALIQALRNVC